MAHAKFSAEEIVEKLRRAEEFTSLGKSIGEAVQSIGISEGTFYRWRREYGGLLRTLGHASDEKFGDTGPSPSACRDTGDWSSRGAEENGRLAADGAFFILRLRGVQPMFDITAIGNELAKHQTVDGPARILFDWSQIRSWPFEPPSAASIRTWNLSAPAIALGAFVHDRKWNRHVALLAALLRVGNAEVRSFRVSDFENATAWLKRELARK